MKAKSNDFDMMGDQLADGVARLDAIRNNPEVFGRLSADQQAAINNVFAQMGVLQSAMKECSDIEHTVPADARTARISQVVNRQDVQSLDGFDNVFVLFGNKDMQTQHNTINREQSVNDLLASVESQPTADAYQYN